MLTKDGPKVLIDYEGLKLERHANEASPTGCHYVVTDEEGGDLGSSRSLDVAKLKFQLAAARSHVEWGNRLFRHIREVVDQEERAYAKAMNAWMALDERLDEEGRP
jgi:hypothetical protein